MHQGFRVDGRNDGQTHLISSPHGSTLHHSHSTLGSRLGEDGNWEIEPNQDGSNRAALTLPADSASVRVPAPLGCHISDVNLHTGGRCGYSFGKESLALKKPPSLQPQRDEGSYP